MKTWKNNENRLTITLEWLEVVLEIHKEPYLVIEGFYDGWNDVKNEKSPSLQEILNFMFEKGYELVTIQPMGNPYCKEIIFKKRM